VGELAVEILMRLRGEIENVLEQEPDTEQGEAGEQQPEDCEGGVQERHLTALRTFGAGKPPIIQTNYRKMPQRSANMAIEQRKHLVAAALSMWLAESPRHSYNTKQGWQETGATLLPANCMAATRGHAVMPPPEEALKC
jgi:hypothetical protein